MYLRSSLTFKRNVIGRDCPERLGERIYIPFSGYGGIDPLVEREVGRVARRCRIHEDKLLGSLKEVLRKTGLSDGMTISFHHHLRNGDGVVNMVMDAVNEMGIRDLRILPTALFPIHEHIIKYLEDGTITSIEGSLNGPLGRFISLGKLDQPVILRSHSGRVRALSQGEIEIDVAFLGVSCADRHGNANGMMGPSAFGPCNFPKADSHFAKKTVLITDHIVDYPCVPMSISATDVDYILKVDSIGDPAGILSGTMAITTDPVRLKIARSVMDIMDEGGLLRNGFSFQAGSGGISLALTKFISDRFKEREMVASFAVGGTTKYLVEMLENGNLRTLLDGQSFDPVSVESLKKNPNHHETFVDQYGNLHTAGTFTEMEQAGFLSATEVDTDFNVNVNTHSDGWLLHGIGGHQDVAYGSQLTFVTIPLLRKGNPIVRENVVTVTSPGETIDVIVTERGIAFNTHNVRKEFLDRNEELERRCLKKGMNVLSIDDLQRKAESLKEIDVTFKKGDQLVALIQYIDGTALDTVWNVGT